MRIYSVFIFCVLGLSTRGQLSIKNEAPVCTNTSFIMAGDVVINEIMADPEPSVGALIYPEYIELYNKKGVAVDIKNWKLCMGSSCKTVAQALIPADSFLVLTSAGSQGLFSATVNVAGIIGFPAISNSGQIIQLLDEKGNIISVISYTDEWYKDPVKKQGGYSLEQVDPLNPCTEEENWRSCADETGGTPGKVNSIKGLNPDKSPPHLQRVNVLSVNAIELLFSEPLDSTTLLENSSYTISNMGHPVKINVIKPFFKSLRLTLGSPLKKQMYYTLTITKQLKDCAGNEMEVNNGVQFALPEAALPGDIVLNEVLFNPKENGVDFIEIFNRSHKVIDLQTLFVGHYDSIVHVATDIEKISTEGYLFFPGTYLVLSTNATIIQQHYFSKDPAAFLTMTKLPSLNSDHGTICLKTITAIIDHFSYDEKMHFDLLTDNKGVSLERVHPDRVSNDRMNWHSAASTAGFATPGYKNSQYMNVEEAEDPIALSAEIFSPDEDGFDDILAIRYHFMQPELVGTLRIYDSKGRLVRTVIRNELIGTSGVVSWDGKNDANEKENVGIYIIYFQVFDLSAHIKMYKKTCVLANKKER